MSGSVNKVILVGHLGREPEIRRMQNGDPIANLSVATSESWKDRQTGERKEHTEWHRIVVFGAGAKFVENYVHKGNLVWVEGMLQTRKYTDKDGIEKYSTEIVVKPYIGSIKNFSSNPNSGEKDNSGEMDTSGGGFKSDHPSDLDDDIPF